MNYILILFFLIRTLHNFLYHLFWWERKEYRFDRMLVHLRETEQGKHWLFHPFSIIKFSLIFLWFLPSSPDWQEIISYAVFSIYAVEGLRSILQFRNGWMKPPFKPRAVGIFAGSVIFLTAVFIVINPLFSVYFSVLILDKLMAPIIAFLVFVSNIYFSFHKKVKIEKAKVRIQSAGNLQIVGITGSYGKTTTKEFTAQILSEKYKILKTIASQNTDIGIAELILRSDLSKYEIFVCEMSAYKIGEINEICKMLGNKIKIAVVTGINEQHQSLFGSIENTMKAKFELVENLSSEGIAFFNKQNNYCHKMQEWAKKRKIDSYLVNDKILKEDNLEKDLPGNRLKENLSLTVAVAKKLNLTNSQLKSALAKLSLPSKTMNVIKKGKITIIDDTFNANPDGVYNALNYLSTFEEKKILALQPLIELGKYADKIHEQIGELAAEMCDEIWIANINFNKPLIRGINKVNGGLGKVRYSVNKNLDKTVILFEGKESEKFLKEIKKLRN